MFSQIFLPALETYLSFKIESSERSAMITHHPQRIREGTLIWGRSCRNGKHRHRHATKVGPKAMVEFPVFEGLADLIFSRCSQIFFDFVFNWYHLTAFDKVLRSIRIECLLGFNYLNVGVMNGLEVGCLFSKVLYQVFSYPTKRFHSLSFDSSEFKSGVEDC